MAVCCRMDTVTATQRKCRVSLLLTHVDLCHRAIKIHISPPIGICPFFQKIRNILNQLIFSRKRDLIETRSFVIRRTANQNFLNFRIFFIGIFYDFVITAGGLYILKPYICILCKSVIHITGIIHAERKSNHGGVMFKNFIQSLRHLLCHIAPDTFIKDINAPIREMGHIIQPYIGMIMSSTSYTVTYKSNSLSLLKNRNALRLHSINTH